MLFYTGKKFLHTIIILNMNIATINGCVSVRLLTMLNCWNCCCSAEACAGDTSPEVTISPSRDGDGGDGECVNQCGDPAAGLNCEPARGDESLGPGDDDASCATDRCPMAYKTCAGAYCSEPVRVTNDGTGALDCWTGLGASTGEWAVVTTGATLFTEQPYCAIAYTHSHRPLLLHTTTGWANKKCATLLLSISSPIMDQFSKFFYWQTLQTICNNVIIIDPTTLYTHFCVFVFFWHSIKNLTQPASMRPASLR